MIKLTVLLILLVTFLSVEHSCYCQEQPPTKRDALAINTDEITGVWDGEIKTAIQTTSGTVEGVTPIHLVIGNFLQADYASDETIEMHTYSLPSGFIKQTSLVLPESLLSNLKGSLQFYFASDDVQLGVCSSDLKTIYFRIDSFTDRNKNDGIAFTEKNEGDSLFHNDYIVSDVKSRESPSLSRNRLQIPGMWAPTAQPFFEIRNISITGETLRGEYIRWDSPPAIVSTIILKRVSNSPILRQQDRDRLSYVHLIVTVQVFWRSGMSG